MSMSPDGKIVATASRDRTVRLWDLQQGIRLRTINAHRDAVNNVRFSPDGKTFATAGSDRLVKPDSTSFCVRGFNQRSPVIERRGN